MEFGWINAVGGFFVVLMLAPNILYALRHTGEKNKCDNRWMNLLEQVGRYTSMVLMVFPLGVWRFGFSNVTAMLVYLFGNGGLLVCYWGYWALFLREKNWERALVLAVVPVCMFLLSGLTLRHWLLVLSATVFGAGHVYVTLKNYAETIDKSG